ncbi:uncharacterized protein LACBIDRAFT_332861 [Laccaria bicolor S238N-H82]|uniref:Predicted protein n=1 Tax=Laccaria bicolor (strain S238N-H82 / ATCC MYA-4686) TaxID=486041 RepID=B0DU36_LACBS|nr:uncharacterized protein LACBIDRAFT_332861 [Laccaria bicolor S238N-H82]EDR01879.1 predicted protein [Laccaria bicolor S238N-H82]|eukprot:XP_001887489.1 predicted protein [Laccaria bicolor S238N-H82]
MSKLVTRFGLYELKQVQTSRDERTVEILMQWVANDDRVACVLNRRNDEITAKDVLDHTDWSLIHNTKSFKDIAFLCIVTAIIVEHSFFLWKQKPSKSTAPFESAIQKFNLSADVAKINTAIVEASHMKTKDQKKQALVKIAMDNRLPHLPRIS